MNSDIIVGELYEMYKDEPMMVQMILNYDLDIKFYEYVHHVDELGWARILAEVASKMYIDILDGLIDYRAIPKVECLFANIKEDVSTNTRLYPWDFIYYHGAISDSFDDKGLTPGDLIKCSIDAYHFPLGIHRVLVSGEPALCYLWQEKKSSGYRDVTGNSYPRFIRHGLIINAEDNVDFHKYAIKCMQDQVVSI